jgi:carboxypeptidase family protein
MKRSIRGWRGFLSLVGCAAVVIACAGAGLAEDEEFPASNLQFLVVRDSNGKPVRNAAVVLHPVNSKGKQSRGGMELKTDNEGKTSFDGVPYGMLRVQVLAQGFQTYGEDFNINKPIMDITIKLKRPQGQFSVYDQPGKKPDEKTPPDQKPQ